MLHLVLELRFKNIVDEVYDKVLSFVFNEAPVDSDKALGALDDLSKAINSKNEIINAKEITERTLDKTNYEGGLSLSVNPKDIINISLGAKDNSGLDIERTSKYSVTSVEKIHFPDLNYSLRKIIEYTQSKIYLLIDEWSSLPIDLQPLLAEFLKRSFLPVPQISIKIAALEYRSNFSISIQKNNKIGFELGSDISTNLDLDDYYVFDRNPDTITNNFSEILYKHILNELPVNYFRNTFSIKNEKDFIRTLFTDSSNFQELVRASEGVIRDMLNIFTLSYFASQRQGKNKIDKKSVLESSRQWFERDKAQNLDDTLNRILSNIVDEVIGKKKARSFLIPRELEKHETIQKLFDARVIHFIKRGYADKDNPGVRHNVYTLDYGTYVDLINTSRKPELDFIDMDSRIDHADFIVPFDDKRSIRRIVLTNDILS